MAAAMQPSIPPPPYTSPFFQQPGATAPSRATRAPNGKGYCPPMPLKLRTRKSERRAKRAKRRSAPRGAAFMALAVGRRIWPETNGLPPRNDQGELPRRRDDSELNRRWNRAAAEVDAKGKSGDRHWWQLLSMVDSSGPEDETDEAYDERERQRREARGCGRGCQAPRVEERPIGPGQTPTDVGLLGCVECA